ncbi:MAG TPA: hypothetical protein VGD36_08115 [Xanthobacteraceae bacterium]
MSDRTASATSVRDRVAAAGSGRMVEKPMVETVISYARAAADS